VFIPQILEEWSLVLIPLISGGWTTGPTEASDAQRYGSNLTYENTGKWEEQAVLTLPVTQDMKTQCDNFDVIICFFITFLDLQDDTTQTPFFLIIYKITRLTKKGNGHEIWYFLLYIFFQHVSLSQILSILHFKMHGVYFLGALINDDVNCYNYMALIINKCMNEYGMS